MNDLLNYLIETSLLLLFGLALLLFCTIGIFFWYVCYPIFTIISTIRTFNRTQDQYKYDLKFWIESLNIIDLILVISYMISLGLYFLSKDAHELCMYINIGSFVVWIFNYNTIKTDYFANRSKFALNYVDFNESKKFIISKINDIMKYDLYPEDLKLLYSLKSNEMKITTLDENEDFKNSISRLLRCKFIIKNIIDEYTYVLSVNKELLPYIDNTSLLINKLTYENY